MRENTLVTVSVPIIRLNRWWVLLHWPRGELTKTIERVESLSSEAVSGKSQNYNNNSHEIESDHVCILKTAGNHKAHPDQPIR